MTATEIAARIAERVEKAPSGGVFTNAMVSPILTMTPESIPLGFAKSEVESEARFRVFLVAGEDYEVRVTRR